MKKDQLLITALLVVIMIYIFSVFGFSFLQDFYYDELPNNLVPSKKGESGCQSMFHCFLTTLHWGLRIEGGVGDFLQAQSYYRKAEYYMFVIFAIAFFIIVNIILQETLFGIIIDTFAEL